MFQWWYQPWFPTRFACALNPCYFVPVVRKGGLEPPRAAPPAPKAGASTNSATLADLPRTFHQAAACYASYTTAVRQTPAASFAERASIAQRGLPSHESRRRNALREVQACPLEPIRPTRVSVGHYENFPVASILVPARLRPAVVAIYRFARAADDLADEGDAPAAERVAALDAFDRELDRIGRGETPSAPPFPALASAIREHGLPLAPF